MKLNLLFLLLSCLIHFIFFLVSRTPTNIESASLKKVSIKISSVKNKNTKSQKLPPTTKAKFSKKSEMTTDVEQAAIETKEEATIPSDVFPNYPHLSRVYEEEGEVILEIEISLNGKVTNLSILKSSGHKRLDEEAIRFIKNTTFIPAKNGQNSNVSSRLVKSITFKLSN